MIKNRIFDKKLKIVKCNPKENSVLKTKSPPISLNKKDDKVEETLKVKDAKINKPHYVVAHKKNKTLSKKTKSEEERKKYEREKKRKQREKIKSNPKALAKSKENERNRSRKRREEGKIKSIAAMGKREQKRQRKKWTESNQRRRERNIAQQNVIEFMENDSPPPTLPIVIENVNRLSSQQVRGRKKLRRDRSKLVRELEKSKSLLKKSVALTEKWKKKYYRKEKVEETPTPRKKAKIIMEQGSKEVKRKLIFGEVLAKQLKQNAKTLKSKKELQLFYKSISGQGLKKYRMLSEAQKIGILKRSTERKYRNIVKNNLKISVERKKRGLATTITKKNLVKTFLEEESNSKMAPGKKDVVTHKKTKKQILYLCDSLHALHKKCCTKYGDKFVSYANFCRFKPFYMKEPKITNRDTCLCLAHENIDLVTNKLHRLKLIKTKNLEEILKTVCCNCNNYECCYGHCSRCQNKEITFLESDLTADNDHLSYYQWKKQKTQTVVKKVVKEIQVTVKEKNSCTVSELKNEFNRLIPLHAKHVYNMNHQFSNLKKLRETLKENEALLIIDFSENYQAKYTKEVQSAHFGGSKKQISIQTGVWFINQQNKLITQQFATISDNCSHQAPAVWAHLLPILKDLIKLDINVVHVQSDGPTSQYKNKSNLFLMTYYAKILQIKEFTWNFTEPGHGKSRADGVGGQLKRYADKCVLYGKDILNAKHLVEAINNKISINVYLIDDEDIVNVSKVIPNLKKQVVPNTMKLRQVVWRCENETKLWLRSLTCLQCFEECKHFGLLPPTHMFQAVSGNIAMDIQPELEPNSGGISSLSENSITIGIWVAVIFDDHWFPGVVEEKNGDELHINFMQRAGEDTFFWPSPPDKQVILWNTILCIIPEAPHPVSSRHFKIKNWDHVQKEFKNLK